MKGKLVLVTGATSGIGKEAALALAKMGARVALVARDPTRGEAARAEIAAASGNGDVTLFVADLSSQKEIRRLADEIRAKHDRLDVLLNNAGVMMTKRVLTADGFETTFAVNHLAYVLLTRLLLPLVTAAAPSRIVNVASEAHRRGTIAFDDLQGAKSYGGVAAYGQSKLANILFTYELARRLEGKGVTANCLHPGVIGTGIARNAPWPIGPVWRLLFRSAESGARTSVFLASSPDAAGVTGKYFIDEKPVRSNRESCDPEIARRLWDVSERLTGD